MNKRQIFLTQYKAGKFDDLITKLIYVALWVGTVVITLVIAKQMEM